MMAVKRVDQMVVRLVLSLVGHWVVHWVVPKAVRKANWMAGHLVDVRVHYSASK